MKSNFRNVSHDIQKKSGVFPHQCQLVNRFHIRCAVPKGTKHSITYDFGVVVQTNDNSKIRNFYCLANGACCATKNKYKMSNGCTSGPTDHLLSRHGIRALKSIMVESTRAELLGSLSHTLNTDIYRTQYNIIPDPDKSYRIRPNNTGYGIIIRCPAF